jgi:hypothetical protein
MAVPWGGTVRQELVSCLNETAAFSHIMACPIILAIINGPPPEVLGLTGGNLALEWQFG